MRRYNASAEPWAVAKNSPTVAVANKGHWSVEVAPAVTRHTRRPRTLQSQRKANSSHTDDDNLLRLSLCDRQKCTSMC